jgi:hypothetical protein
MKTNFPEQFKSYSNIELLKILQRPDDYQPEAVQAARNLLSEREVSPEELDEVQMHFQALDDDAAAKSERLNNYRNTVEDFLEPVIHPTREVGVAKWLKVFLVAVIVQYMFVIYESVAQIIQTLRCGYCSFYIAVFAMLNLLYVPAVFYLLYKKRRWGWIILFADNLFSVISKVSSSLTYYQYVQPTIIDSGFLLIILFKIALLFFLWKKEVAHLFGVTSPAKVRTAAWVSIGTVVFIGSLYLIYR